MSPTTLPPAVLATTLSACATEPVLLNSQRIEQRFGSYGIAVLASEAGLRRSSLYSLFDGKPICRTYAVVRFTDQLDDRYREEHTQVLAGNSIGAIFRSQGWDFHKQTLHIGSLALPRENTSIGRLMQVPGPQELALHIYQLLLVRQEQVLEYATILEAHHPGYLTEHDLRDLYKYDTESALQDVAVAGFKALVLDRKKSQQPVCRDAVL